MRELQGALNRLIACQTLGGEHVDADAGARACSATCAEQRRRVDAAAAARTSSPSFLTDISIGRRAARRAVEGARRRGDRVLDRRGLSHGGCSSARCSDAHAAAERRVAAARLRGDASTQLRELERQVAAARRGARRRRARSAIPSGSREARAVRSSARSRGAAPPPGPSAAFTRAGFEVGASQPAGRARGRRDRRRAGPALQPAVHPRAERRRQDAPAERDRQRAGRAARRRTARVACVGAQLFIDELIAALQEGTIERWRARYRAADALLHRRRAVRRRQGAHAGRALPRLQRAFTPTASSSCSRAIVPPQASSTGSRIGCARASRAASSCEMQSPDRALREKLYARFLARRRRRADAGAARLSRRAPGGERARDHRHRESRSARRRDVAGVPLTLALARAGARAGGRRRRRAPRRVRQAADVVLPRRREDRLGVARRRRPPDRGAALMAIKGSLKEASLPDVLQLLAMGKKTGCLSVTHRNNFGYIYFDKGRICYASIVNRRDRLGDMLVKSGVDHAGAARRGDRGAGRRSATSASASCSSSRARSRASSCTTQIRRADRGGGLLPVHLDAGDVQLRGGRRARRSRTSSSRSIRSRCCSRARAASTSGA